MEEITEYIEEIGAAKVGTVALSTLLSATVVFVVCFILIRVVTTVVHRFFSKEQNMGARPSSFLERIIKIILWVLTSIIIADVLGVPTTSLVAAVSVVGLALSLSVQNIMSHVFSGITLLITKPFVAGDYVEVAGHSGTVRRVGVFYTALLTLNNELVNIPNGDVTSAAIVNYSGMPLRRVEQFFSASYDTPTQKVYDALREAAQGDDRIQADPAPTFSVRAYHDSSIEYVSRVWCKPQEYFDVLYGMNERVRECFARHGVEMTYNHLNVHLDR